jgi:transposase-like protein
MNLIELSKYLQDEQAAENYLYEKEILKRFTVCPHCGSDKLGHISRGRIKCYKCKKEWHKRKGSFLEGKQISASKFIAFLKLYADEYGVNRISEELGIDIKSVIELHSKIRCEVINAYYKTKPSINSKYWLYIVNNEIEISSRNIDNNADPITSDYMIINFERTKEFGNLYSFLIDAQWVGTKIKYKSMLNTFISYIKMKLISYRGVKVEYFFEYFLETIIKYNNRGSSFLNIVSEILSKSKGG